MTPEISENTVIDSTARNSDGWLTPFVPRRGLQRPSADDCGQFSSAPAFQLASVAETVEVDPADGSRVLCHCHWQPETRGPSA